MVPSTHDDAGWRPPGEIRPVDLDDAARAGSDDDTGGEPSDGPHTAPTDSWPHTGRPRDEFTTLFGHPELVGVGVDRADLRGGRFDQSGSHGQTLDRRKGGASDDVLVTLLAHPALAAERAVVGPALRASRRLRVDIDERRSERRDIVWDASLRTLWWKRRAARLRLYGSASMNVTVLTLTPAVGRRRPSRWFVRSGNRAMATVVEALETDIADLRWQAPGTR